MIKVKVTTKPESVYLVQLENALLTDLCFVHQITGKYLADCIHFHQCRFNSFYRLQMEIRRLQSFYLLINVYPEESSYRYINCNGC